jgi:YD repeat-containing protein
MILPNGEMVDFTYVNTPVMENLPSISESKDIYSFKRFPSVCGNSATSFYQIFPNVPPTRVINYSRQTLSYVSEIKFAKGRIEFLSDNSRLDLVGSRKLNFIKIYNNSSVLVNEFEFTYDYFISENLGLGFDNYLNTLYYNTGKQGTEITHRLKLLSVKEKGAPPYTFQYDNLTLPKKTSFAADYWGFYNGKIENSSFFPNIYMHGIYEYNDPIGTISNSLTGIKNNRSSNLLSTRASVLNKVSYPTGGNANYTYELNEFNNYSVPDEEHSVLTDVFLNDRNLPSDNLAQAFSSDVTSFLYEGELNINTHGPLSNQTNGNSAYIRMTVLKKTPANNSLVYNTPATFWPMYHTTPYGQLENLVNDVISDSRILQFDLQPNNMGYETFKLKLGDYIKIDPDKIYIIQVNLDNSFGPQDSYGSGANASARFKFLKNSYKEISHGGGLRLKEVRIEESYNKPIIKRYMYENGKLMSPLVFMTKNSFNYDFGQILYYSLGLPVVGYDFYEVTKTSLSSSSFYSPSANASGKYIGYSKVTETNISEVNGSFTENENGKLVETFINEPDFGILDPSLLPSDLNPNNINPLNFLYPSRRNPINNGQPNEVIVYDKSNNILEKKKYTYTPIPSKCIYGRVSANAGQYLYTGGCSSAPFMIPIYNVGFYPILGYKNLIAACSTLTYSGTNVLSVIERYYYDSRDQLKTYERSDSKNGIFKTTNKYPYDFPEFTFTMTKDNFINRAIETISEQGLNGSHKMKYFFNSSGGSTTPRVYLQSKVESSYGNNPLEADILFEKYGEVGTKQENRLLQFKGRDGVITSIFWGYDGQYPVAKVVNVPYDVAKSFISQTLLDNPTNDANLRNHLEGLRAIPNSLITTYTYKPLIGITSETDPNGRTTYFEYDSFNRLMHVKDQHGNIVKRYCYNYAGQLINCDGNVPITYYNSQSYSGQFTRTNCPTGYSGSTITYTVPEQTVSSNISVIDANAKALAKVSTDGPGYANLEGECIPNVQPGPCNLVIFSPIYLPTYSLYCNGNQTSGYIVVWFPNGITMGSSVSIGAFSGGNCKPFTHRFQTVESGGRTYSVKFGSNGVISVQLVTGGDLPAQSTISINSINFNL